MNNLTEGLKKRAAYILGHYLDDGEDQFSDEQIVEILNLITRVKELEEVLVMSRQMLVDLSGLMLFTDDEVYELIESIQELLNQKA